MPMSVGAIAMSASTIIVAANAQLLRRLELRHEPSTGLPLSRSAAPATMDSTTR
jgi:Cu2+-exporting ATPase